MELGDTPEMRVQWRLTLAALKDENRTTRQVCQALAIEPVNASRIRQRLNKLHELGLVCEAGKTAPVGKVRGSTLWSLTRAGRDWLRQKGEDKK